MLTCTINPLNFFLFSFVCFVIHNRESLCTFHTGFILAVRFGYFSILSENIPNSFHFRPTQIHKAGSGRSSPGQWIVPVPGRGRVPPSAPHPWSGTAAGGSPAPPGSQTETCRRRTWQVSCLQLDKDSRLSVRLADVGWRRWLFPPRRYAIIAPRRG